MEVKVGDIVHVRAKVRAKNSLGYQVELLTSSDIGPSYVNDAAIVHVEPPPLKVGDTVRHRSMDWTVSGIDGELLWIKTTATCGVDHASVHRDEVQRYS